MNVHLDERAIPDDFEAVNLAGLDDENVPSATFKRLSVRVSGFVLANPEVKKSILRAFPDKLDLIIRMPIGRGLYLEPANEKVPGPLPRSPLNKNTETPTSPCSAPANSCELPTNGNSS
jgi:hypothetical protein